METGILPVVVEEDEDEDMHEDLNSTRGVNTHGVLQDKTNRQTNLSLNYSSPDCLRSQQEESIPTIERTNIILHKSKIAIDYDDMKDCE